MNFLTKILIILFLNVLLASCNSGPGGENATTGNAASVTLGKGVTYALNAGSKVMWRGSKPNGNHDGVINISEGTLKVDGKNVTGGSFVIDMSSIVCTDLSGGKKGQLENHLKSIDFFDVEKYSTAKFDITKVDNLTEDNTATHMIHGNLTIKDITKNIAFKTIVTVEDDALKAVTPQFKIDRTSWNVQYNSKKIFPNIADKIINDHIALSIALSAKKS